MTKANNASFCSPSTKAAFNLILRAVQFELQCKYSEYVRPLIHKYECRGNRRSRKPGILGLHQSSINPQASQYTLLTVALCKKEQSPRVFCRKAWGPFRPPAFKMVDNYMIFIGQCFCICFLYSIPHGNVGLWLCHNYLAIKTWCWNFKCIYDIILYMCKCQVNTIVLLCTVSLGV